MAHSLIVSLKPWLAVGFLALAACTNPHPSVSGSIGAPARSPAASVSSPPAVSASGSVDTPAIRAALERLYPGAPVNDVGPSPIPGVVQARAGQDVYFLSPDGRYALRGELLDTQVKGPDGDLTQVMRHQLRQELLQGLDAKEALVQTPPKGVAHKGTLAVFFDVDCTYCRQIQANAKTYTQAGLTLAYYPYPRTGVASTSGRALAEVWCAKPSQRVRILDNILAGSQPLAGDACAEGQAIVTKYNALARRVGLAGTPGIYTEKGNLIGGYIDAPLALQRLADEAKMPPL